MLGLAHLDDDALELRLRAARHEGDPLADALVEALRAQPGAWATFEAALCGGAAPAGPPELLALLAQASAPPTWADEREIAAGAASLWRAGAPALMAALTYGSLAFGYGKPDLARPLGMTGRLDRMAGRRLAETSRWYLAATVPGAAAVGEEGWRSSLRVRVVHALVRRRLAASPAWDADAWGVPLSSAGLLLTGVGGFHVIPQRALQDLGVRATPADRDARTALWRWLAWVMGAPEELLPADHAEAERIVEVAARIDAGVDHEHGPALLRALTHRPAPVPLPGARRVSTAVAEALSRRWMGEAEADALGLPQTPLGSLVPLLRPAMRLQGELLGAGGRLAGQRRTARLQVAVASRLLDLTSRVPAPVSPAETEAAPVLRDAA